MIYLYRVLIGAIISVGGGYSFSLLVSYSGLMQASSDLILLSMMSFAGGVILGALLNWKPLLTVKETSRILYEIDDDEEFEREIEDSFHGS